MGKMKSKRNAGVIVLVASLLFAVTFMDTWMVFRQNRQQLLDLGTYQLSAISGQLETTIHHAESLTMELAARSREFLSDKEQLRGFVYAKKAEVLMEDTGAFNVYIAGSDYSFIPDFDAPDDYVATERIWYTGAIRNDGKPYVSPPYQDAMTGQICYTVSVMLGDRDSVIAVDYTMETIQAHIEEMYAKGNGKAIIVTGEGIIAGCNDETQIGKNLIEVMPEYAGIYALAKSKDGVVTGRLKADFLYENLFATHSGSDWYLLVSESDWELYRDSYIQLIATTLLSLALFVIIILLYLRAIKNGKEAQQALATKEEFLDSITAQLQEPLERILERSSRESIEHADDYEAQFAGIHESGQRLSEMIGQIISYSNIVKNEKKQSGRSTLTGKKSRRYRGVIIAFLIFVMLISLYANISATYRWGNNLMRSRAEEYEYEFSEWIQTQKSILDMFVSIFSTNPEMMDDYEGTVQYLNDITLQYPEISATYMACKDRDPSVYMNSGWKPEPGWKVEERPWYVDTMNSETGWSISSPYYDDQTGSYCVTMSRKVYDARTGEFMGIFGIDFFMDKLVEILGGSYSDDGYAFLADISGDIINHPYGSYQMSVDGATNISSLPYGEAKIDSRSTHLIKDYDGSLRIVLATRNNLSDFTIFVAADIWEIYGRVVVYGVISFAAFLICIILVYKLLTDLIRWQDEATLKMQQAADEAIAAGKAKSSFLAQMSHEIRTPINAVLGMNEMILRTSKDSEILDYSANIQSAGRTLLSLINSILDFSKIEDGKMEIIPVKYETSALVNDLVHSISERAKEKNLDFIVQVDPKLPSVMFGDDVRLSQIIMNLLTNAVKYTREGSVTLILEDYGRDDDNVALNVKVKDTGIGIKEEDMDKLFASFERIEEKRNRNIEGTGLGMSIVTKLLGMLDSKLEVESVYGEGSTFSFYIMQGIVDSEPIGDYQKRLEQMDRRAEEGTNFTAAQAKVLVVDDNEMNTKVARNLMGLYGIKPDIAMSGEEGIEKIKAKKYDLIFLDHMMPKMDGIETLQKLKEEKIALPPMVALTANAVVGARETYLQAGFDDYLSKPIEMKKLEDKLRRFLPANLIVEGKSEAGNPEKETKTENAVNAGNGTANTENTADIIAAKDAENPDATDAGRKTEPKNKTEALADIGISMEDGMRYCASDQDFYFELLGDFAAEMPDKKTELEGLFAAGDLDGYKTKVHALKSTSKTIGAMEISELARKLERGSARGNAAFVEEHHTQLMDMYTRLAGEIAKIL
ncbi:MAG: response regulator [Lachnospiraceae bacterium]|nr:response regulator [Lachnospiraceae bacterium]